MSIHILKSFARSSPLIAAAFPIRIGTAMGADRAGDVQQQMRELLAGKSATRSALSSEGHDGATPRPGADAQELARRLVLGVTDSRIKGTEPVTPPADAMTPNDSILVQGYVQTMAQRLVLGVRHAAGS
jgi:hypothetical protein